MTTASVPTADVGIVDLAGEDPYPLYRKLREQSPVLLGNDGLWLVTGYQELRAVNLDPRASSNPAARPDYEQFAEEHLDGVDGPLARMQRSMFVFMDDPEHRRLRQLFQMAFTPASVTALRPGLEAKAKALVAAAGDEMDVVADLALPLTSSLIGELLGVPEADRAAAVRRAEMMGATGAPVVTPEVLAAATAALAESTEHLLGLVEERRRVPKPDLLTALAQAESGGDRMTDDEIVSSALLLFNAGYETTTALIANAVATLLGNPAELAELRARPELMPAAVEEVLRYEPSFQYGVEITTEPMVVGGVPVPAGEAVVLIGGAANRDPAEFPDPERFSITRTGARHLAFGIGMHHCLGAPLARLEGQVGLAALLAAWPEFELGPGGVERAVGSSLRRVDRLPIRRP
ncbi:cytochrome P450 [Pseudonocardia sp. TRM90224]|uniref:cytochrome P450 n=1 Tax=Pseudonocardia sp. TRM90224 TaxID=2812678 RepID=UPI001E565022|nr:cytochrome P450 [Pseudonocardia sp. TRM90224]